MKKILGILFALCLMLSMAACDESSEEPEMKTTLTVDEIAEEEYSGELSGCSFSNEAQTMFTDIAASDFVITLKDGQITFDNEGVAKSKGVLNGTDSPESPEYKIILSGTLPMEQNGEDKVSAEGDVTLLGEEAWFYYNDGQFVRWEIKNRGEGKVQLCTIDIKMKDGIPVAEFVIKSKKNKDAIRTCTLPLKLKDKAAE